MDTNRYRRGCALARRIKAGVWASFASSLATVVTEVFAVSILATAANAHEFDCPGCEQKPGFFIRATAAEAEVASQTFLWTSGWHLLGGFSVEEIVSEVVAGVQAVHLWVRDESGRAFARSCALSLD